MTSPANKRRVPVVAPGPSRPDKREGRDRRADPAAESGSQSARFDGQDRRQGPRRRADLRRPLWQQPFAALIAAGLGVLAALQFDPTFTQADAPESAPEVDSPTIEWVVDPDQLAAARLLRSEAEALHSTTLVLDPHAHELWQPRIRKIEILRADPETPPALRSELDATVAALARAGLWAHPMPD